MSNCPNCGAVVSIYDKICPYCGRQNHITVDDIMNTPIKGAYIEQNTAQLYDTYRDAYGVLHRTKLKPIKTITITEE